LVVTADAGAIVAGLVEALNGPEATAKKSLDLFITKLFTKHADGNSNPTRPGRSDHVDA
jgi:hypothetical protein